MNSFMDHLFQNGMIYALKILFDINLQNVTLRTVLSDVPMKKNVHAFSRKRRSTVFQAGVIVINQRLCEIRNENERCQHLLNNPVADCRRFNISLTASLTDPEINGWLHLIGPVPKILLQF